MTLHCNLPGGIVYAGSETMFSVLDQANLNLSGSQEDAVQFMVAIPAQGVERWETYLFKSTIGRVLFYMRQSMLNDLGMVYGIEIDKYYYGGQSGIYDCEFAQLAHLWYQAMTGKPANPGVRRLTATEVSWLITASISFEMDVSRSQCAKHSTGFKTMIMDGYGTVITPNVAGCIEPTIKIPGIDIPDLPPGEALPENKDPVPPTGINPVGAKEKKDKSSVWPYVALGAAGLLAVVLVAKAK